MAGELLHTPFINDMSALLNSIRNVMRTRHYSYATEKTYIYWIKRYIFFHNVRHPLEMGTDEVNQFLRRALEVVGIEKRASCHTLRHSFATNLLQNGYDIRTIQDLLGHKEVTTKMIYTHVLQQNRLGARSPVDLRIGN